MQDKTLGHGREQNHEKKQRKKESSEKQKSVRNMQRMRENAYKSPLPSSPAKHFSSLRTRFRIKGCLCIHRYIPCYSLFNYSITSMFKFYVYI